MVSHRHTEPPLVSTGEVARLFQVDPNTVRRWSKAGKLTPVITPGGQRRYQQDEVDALYAAGFQTVRELAAGVVEGGEAA